MAEACGGRGVVVEGGGGVVEGGDGCGGEVEEVGRKGLMSHGRVCILFQALGKQEGPKQGSHTI